MPKFITAFVSRAALVWRKPILLAALSLGLSLIPTLNAAPAADGLYATFRIKRGASSLGEFTCKLVFDKVPRTVANFVGLAEDSLPWMDFQNGHAVRRPFYEGIVFHRVVANFVIQAGSPNGTGNDGPGYTFRDEFDPTLRHSKAGILSMANSGLYSNGSQFFITLRATPELDDVHSVFGEVVEGLSIATSVQQGDVIESVVITRNGAAARAFDVTIHGIPSVLDAVPRLHSTAGGFPLNYAKPANTEFFVFHSDDLGSWRQLPGLEMYGLTPASTTRDVSSVTTNRARKFFNVAKVQYPDAIYTPPSVTGKKLTLNDAGGIVLAFSFSSGTNGTYNFTQGTTALGPFPVKDYGWNQEAYRGQFLADISGLTFRGWPVTEANVTFVFTAANAGTFAGSLINLIGDHGTVSGTFSVANL